MPYRLGLHLSLKGDNVEKTEVVVMVSAHRRGSGVVFDLVEGLNPATRDVKVVSQHLCTQQSLGCMLFGYWDMALGV